MILSNEISREETKTRLEKREKIKTCFQEIKTLRKDREKLLSELELTNRMETLSRLNTRNVNKRISRAKNKNIDLTKENEEKLCNLKRFSTFSMNN